MLVQLTTPLSGFGIHVLNHNVILIIKPIYLHDKSHVIFIVGPVVQSWVSANPEFKFNLTVFLHLRFQTFRNQNYN